MDPKGMLAKPSYGQGQEEMAEEGGMAGYEICIRVDMDGMLSVGIEDDSTPQTEGLEGDEDKSGYKPVEDIREALTVALDMYRERSGKAEESDSEEAFATSFKATRGDMGGMR